MLTIHVLPFTANGSLITPIAFTYSLQLREKRPLSPSLGDTEITLESRAKLTMPQKYFPVVYLKIQCWNRW